MAGLAAAQDDPEAGEDTFTWKRRQDEAAKWKHDDLKTVGVEFGSTPLCFDEPQKEKSVAVYFPAGGTTLDAYKELVSRRRPGWSEQRAGPPHRGVRSLPARPSCGPRPVHH